MKSKKHENNPNKSTSHRGYDHATDRFNFSVNRMEQNGFVFYTTSIPSDVLGQTCFVTSRYENAEEGFQRNLNLNKAQQIANYIDIEKGTIPTSIILSAQPLADAKIKLRKTISFKNVGNAFLVIDGQHRVWGYKLAKTSIRVPVVIYTELSKEAEARIFIDVNSKQTPVPPALLLDIKQLAQTQDHTEALLANVFDLFYSNPESVIIGKMAKAGGDNKKLNRVNFNRALKPLLKGYVRFENKSPNNIFELLNTYLKAFLNLEYLQMNNHIAKSNVFYTLMFIFPEVIKKLYYRYNKEYSLDNFTAVLNESFGDLTESKLKANISNIKSLKDLFLKKLEEQEVIKL